MLAGVCAQLQAGAQLYVATSGCAPLSVAEPVCEPTNPPGDAGADAEIEASVDAAADSMAVSAPDAMADATVDGTVSDGGVSATDGSASDGGGGGCVPASCTSLGYDCGPAADGCGNLLQCGPCTGGMICGLSSPNVCGSPASCSLCAQVAACGTTTLSGKVVTAGATADPVPGVTVFVPNGTPSPFPSGVAAGCTATPPTVNFTNARHRVDGVLGSTENWIDGHDPNDGGTGTQQILFAVGTPVSASTKLGQMFYAGFHVEPPSGTVTPSVTFPAECNSNPMTVEDQVFEYLVFQMAGTTCAPTSPTACTPQTCVSQSVGCGQAGDGCGNLIAGSCGTCTAPQTCGGGGVFAQCGP